MLERSKSEVLRDNANVVAAEEKCSSIIVFLRVPSLACLCAATHSCVRSFVPSSMYTVHCTTFLGQNGAHHLRLPLRLVSATVDVPADDAAKFERKSARSEALQAASGLAASESLMLTKDEASGGTTYYIRRTTCSRWMQRVQRQSIAGARCERECRGTIGRVGGGVPARCVAGIANAYM